MWRNLLGLERRLDRAMGVTYVKTRWLGVLLLACVLAPVVPLRGEHGFAIPGSAAALPSARVSAGEAAGLKTGCLTNCFEAAGRDLGVLASVCLTGRAITCAIPCADSVDSGCLDCVSAAGTVCGVAIGGSLGVCVAQCVNPGAEQPTPTATRTGTARPTTTPPRPQCPGDCDGNGRVDVSELVRGVRVLLGAVPHEECRAADANANGFVVVSELVGAVNAALHGCTGETLFLW